MRYKKKLLSWISEKNYAQLTLYDRIFFCLLKYEIILQAMKMSSLLFVYFTLDTFHMLSWSHYRKDTEPFILCFHVLTSKYFFPIIT